MNEKAATNSSLRRFLRKPAEEDPTTVHPSIQAEVKMTMMIVHHNTFFNLSEHLTQIVKSEFQGSAAAENFACGRTKTSAIINCLGDEFKAELVDDMKKFPFSFMIDGSNDTGIAKMHAVTVRIYDVNFNRVMTKLLDMNLIEGSTSGTAATIFQHVNALFQKYEISGNSVAGLGVDNTNVNIGARDSIKSRVLAKQPNVVVAGCPCHMLHNTAAKGATAFADATGFDLEDHCVDLFYWFDKSTKRKGILKQYCMFCDTKYGAVVKYVSVRWLCLERCLDRELKKYHALKSYFLSQHESDNRFKRLNELFQRPMSEIYLMFFQSAIALLTNFNRFLQREDPLIYLMHTQMETFLKKLAVKFIRPEKVMEHKETFGTFKGLDISLENQKADAADLKRIKSCGKVG